MEDGRPFAFAGLWDRWKAPDGAVIESFTISTVTPNDLMRPLHNRMPCILGRENYHRWLDPEEDSKPLQDLLQPYPAEKMCAWRVGRLSGMSEMTMPR
jgi:putative SOS response-associated peptidase YedK